MARLTWNDVAVPNLSGGVEGIRAAGEMFDRAMRSAKGVVTDLQGQQSDAADSAVLSDLLRYQGSPDALMADLGSGAFQSRHKLDKISSTMRDYLAKAPGELLEFAVKKSAYDEGQKGIADMDHMRANRAVINPWIDAIRTGNDRQAAALAAANPDVFNKMDTGKYIGAIRSGQDLFGDDVRNDDMSFDSATKQTEWGEDRAMAPIWEDAVGSAPDGNPEYILNSKRDEIVAKHGEYVFSRLLARARGQQSGGGAGAGGGGGGGSVAPLGAYATPDNASAIVAGAKDLGIAPEDLATIISYETGGKFDPSIRGGKNNKHIGLIQFGEAEQGQFGASQNQSFGEQMGAVVRYLKARGARPGDDITTLYKIINGGNRNANINASDGNGTIGGHVEQMLAKHRDQAVAFLRGTGPGARQAAVNASTIMQQTVSGDPMVETARTFADVWQDKSSARAVAQKLTGKGGPFEGQSTDNVTNFIKRIQQRGGNINAAMAGRVAEISHKGGEGGLASFFDGWANPFSDGLTHNYDWKEIDQHLNMLKNPRALADAMNKLDQINTSQANMGQASAALADVTARMRAAQQNAARLNRPFDQNYWNQQLLAAGAQNGVAVTGGAQTATSTYRDRGGEQEAPKATPAPRREAPKRAPAVSEVSAPTAKAAQTQLVSAFQQMEKRGMGFVSKDALEEQFQRRYGITIQEARSNPKAALAAVKRQDKATSRADASQLLASAVSRVSTRPLTAADRWRFEEDVD
jgi:hypothetical protein